MKILITSFFLLVVGFVQAQKDYDVLHYRFQITLTDKSDTIYGVAGVKLKFLSETSSLALDLVLQQENGKGMIVERVGGRQLKSFDRKPGKIIIHFASPQKAGDTITVTVPYRGIPADGLIISKNKFGNRTFFSDNWPDRAHNWIPCKDDPADKASVEFLVTAPDHYQVVSNGIQIEETKLSNNTKLTHWKEDQPLPTKVMAIGVADFAVQTSAIVNCVTVTSWVYPEDREKGFHDYALAADILSFFSNYIAPYPYKKLANVQSKTIFGGMENANTIFYSEASVTGNRESESLLAHEIAHQWYGNMATEKSYAHLWLSEGFATYLTHLYLEAKYGSDKLISGLEEDRQQIIEFTKNSKNPVVDHSLPWLQMLNANSYQKGSWILHMLRRQTGDSMFKKILRSYYEQFKGKNADSKDFQTVAEQVSRKKLDSFFDQWLNRGGIPQLQITWKYLAKEKQVALTVRQQGQPYSFPLQISIQESSGSPRIVTYTINKQEETFRFSAKSKPIKLVADPLVSLLFEGTLQEVK